MLPLYSALIPGRGHVYSGKVLGMTSQWLEMLDISLTHAFRHLHDAPSVFHFLLWFETLEVKSPEETLHKNAWIMFLNWCLHLGARREMRTVNFLDSDTFSSESWVQNLYVFKSFYQSKHQKGRMFVFLIFFPSKYTLDISHENVAVSKTWVWSRQRYNFSFLCSLILYLL